MTKIDPEDRHPLPAAHGVAWNQRSRGGSVAALGAAGGFLAKKKGAVAVFGEVSAMGDQACDLVLQRACREGDNPAAWRGNLKELLPAPGKVPKAQHHPALDLRDVAGWWSDLAKRDGMAAKALQFLALTAARSGEVRGTELRHFWPDFRVLGEVRVKRINEIGIWQRPDCRSSAVALYRSAHHFCSAKF